MAKRETTIAKEIAIAEKLIRRKSTSDTLKKKLKSKVDRLKKEARGIPMTAKQLASANLRQRAKLKELSKRDFNDLVRRLSKKKEYTFLKGMSLDEVVRDMARKAKPVGWRFKGQGNYKTPSAAQVKKGRASGDVYYEARPNRSDVSQSTRLETGGEISSDQAYYMADVIADNLKDAGMCEDARKCRDVIEKAIMGIEYFPFARYTFEDEPVYAKRGGKQGYNDRDDESLGMSHRESKSQGMKSRRDESKGMRKSMGERAYRDDQMGKGGIISVGNTVMVRDSGKSMKVTDIAKNSKGQIEFSGALGSFLIGDLRKKSTMEKGGKTGDPFTYDEGPGESDIMDTLEDKITYKGKMGYVDSESSWLGNSDKREDEFHRWFHGYTAKMKTLQTNEVDIAKYDAENGFIFINDSGFELMGFPVNKLPKSFNAKPMKF